MKLYEAPQRAVLWRRGEIPPIDPTKYLPLITLTMGIIALVMRTHISSTVHKIARKVGVD